MTRTVRWYCMIAAVFGAVGLLVAFPTSNDVLTIVLAWVAWALIMLTGFIRPSIWRAPTVNAEDSSD